MSIFGKLFSSASLLSALSVASVSLHAASITIQNPSFEGPVVDTAPFYNSDNVITGWSVIGSAGVYQPGHYPGILPPAPDGVQAGYINGGSVSQVLSANLQPNTTYTLSIQVAGRTDGFNPGTGYSIQLLGGANVLTSVVPVVPANYSWTTLTATYTSGNSVLPNTPLGIVISYPTLQLTFDNVSLTETAHVPDGGSTCALMGLGMMAFAGFRRKLSARG